MALAAFLAAIAFRPIYSICLAGYQSYVVAYLFLLYLLLIPGLVSGAGGRYVVFYYALSFLLLSPLLITGRRVRWAKLAAIIATVIPLAIGFMFSIYAATTGEILNKTSLFVIYQTNLREAFGYIETSLDQRIIVAFVLLFPGSDRASSSLAKAAAPDRPGLHARDPRCDGPTTRVWDARKIERKKGLVECVGVPEFDAGQS